VTFDNDDPGIVNQDVQPVKCRTDKITDLAQGAPYRQRIDSVAPMPATPRRRNGTALLVAIELGDIGTSSGETAAHLKESPLG
jgi:hypothetical protein